MVCALPSRLLGLAQGEPYAALDAGGTEGRDVESGPDIVRGCR